MAACGGWPSDRARLVRRPSPRRTSSALEEVDLVCDGRTLLQLVFKDTSRAAMHDEARRVKPAAVLDPRREVETYRRVLMQDPCGTAVCHGSVLDERRDRYWLILERVPGIELWQTDDPTIWLHVARWLAATHVSFARAGVPDRAHELHAIDYDAAYCRYWLVRARRRLGGRRGAVGSRAEGLAWLASRHGVIVRHLLTLPATFIHGEFYASNVIVHRAWNGLRVCPVDWEMAAVGPGLMDLAALTAGRWSDAQRFAMAEAYRDELAEQGVPWPDRNRFLEALTCCRIQIAVQWLGWFGTRAAPPEHSHDWLQEAISLTRQLGV